MNDKNIPKKILYWYDNNKRFLPWRKKVSKEKREYYTLVSEFMLQQTQVKTVIPYFLNFINKIPNINQLAKVKNEKLMRYWEGLGYYSRARNLKNTAVKILKEYINNKIHFFGTSNRSSDYAQAIMEIGAIVCKPNIPLCEQCPISKYCISFKKNDFFIKSKNKFNKTKYFEAKIYQNNNTYLLVKNNKFNFLKNMPIFPMTEVEEKKYKYSNCKKINIKLSNMDMKIILNKIDRLPNIKNKILLNRSHIKSLILPSFTKKIFSSISKI